MENEKLKFKKWPLALVDRGKFSSLSSSGLNCLSVGQHWKSSVCNSSKYDVASKGMAATSAIHHHGQSTKHQCYPEPEVKKNYYNKGTHFQEKTECFTSS